MRIGNKLAVLQAITAISLFGACVGQADAAYPERTVTIICPYPPGGDTDVVARIVAQKLSARWHQPVIVYNRPGADGVIAENFEHASRSDGYTLMAISNTFLVTPSLHRMEFDPLKAFKGISEIGHHDYVLVVNQSLPVKTIADLLKYAKAHQNSLNYSQTGVSSIPNLAMVMLEQKAAVRMTGVSYQGEGPALLAVLGNEVQMTLATVPAAAPYIAAGKLRAIAVTSAGPSPLLPSVPTMAQALGSSSFIFSSFEGLITQADTPPEIIKEIHDGVVVAINSPDVRSALQKQGTTLDGSSPADFTAYLTKNVARFQGVVSSLGVKKQ